MGVIYQNGLRITLVLWLVYLMTGCSTTGQRDSVSYINPSYDFTQVKRVAVLPFSNDSQNQAAAEKVRKLVITELLSSGYMDVVEPGQVTKTISQLGLSGTMSFSSDDFKKIGNGLNIPVVILGTVSTFERTNIGNVSVPEINIFLWAVETQSGSVVWSVTSKSEGLGVKGQLFGFSSDTLTDAAMETVRKAVQTLFK